VIHHDSLPGYVSKPTSESLISHYHHHHYHHSLVWLQNKKEVRMIMILSITRWRSFGEYYYYYYYYHYYYYYYYYNYYYYYYYHRHHHHHYYLLLLTWALLISPRHIHSLVPHAL